MDNHCIVHTTDLMLLEHTTDWLHISTGDYEQIRNGLEQKQKPPATIIHLFFIKEHKDWWRYEKTKKKKKRVDECVTNCLSSNKKTKKKGKKLRNGNKNR